MKMDLCDFVLILLILISFPVLGYLVYGGMFGFFAIAMLMIACLLALSFSLIPYIGIIFQVVIIFNFIFPMLEDMGIYNTALTSYIIGASLFVGLFTWVLSSEIGENKINAYYRKRGYKSSF
ncbi:MAG: hypothetical protein PHU17_02135 [Candidatus Pacebacteria bacterium]|nr:hypothetical protein [Candidatus Paceibacterota bacterium]